MGDDTLLSVCGCFFFQAEDGIRDLVRSRGLGDVYKRQAYILREMSDLLRRIGRAEKADEYENLYNVIKKSINENLWDGEWYIRAINDLGDPIGSKDSPEGKIFLNAQSWAVISGVAEGERAQSAMASAGRLCKTPKGPKILHPAYTQVNGNIGLATRCVPGKKENGAVFNHPVSWAYLAELLLKHADTAFQYYKQALPINPVVDIDRYEMEPYVYSEYVTLSLIHISEPTRPY
mgnify:CR=1 FL=1